MMDVRCRGEGLKSSEGDKIIADTCLDLQIMFCVDPCFVSFYNLI